MRRNGRQMAAVGVLAMTLGGSGALAQTATPPAAAQGSTPGSGPAQGQGRRGQYAGMGRVMGEVTALTGATVTVRAEDGSTVQVVTTDNTRLMKDRGPIRLTDLHPGDGLVAIGNLDAPNKTLHAAMVMAEDAAQVKAMRDNLGKTYITGRVTAVDLDNAKLTVERPDHVSQTISLDESTSFRRAVRGGGGGNGGPGGNGSGGEGSGGPGGSTGRGPGGGSGFGGGGMGMGGMAMNGGIDRAFDRGESITLADIKVGDYVAGTGTIRAGAFVPAHLLDSPPGQRRQRNGAGTEGQPGAPSGPGAGASAGPGGL